MKSDRTAPPVVMLPTNFRVVATEDLLLELTAIELGNTELRALEPGTELGARLEDLAEETAPPHTVPFIVGRSAVAPFFVP